MYDLNNCLICGKPLPPAIRLWAQRDMSPKTCSIDCENMRIKQMFACCDKAERIPCVCAYAFRCAEHGEKHIGTHE